MKMSLELIERHGAAKTLNFVKTEGKADHITKLTHLFLNDRRLHEIVKFLNFNKILILFIKVCGNTNRVN